MDGGELDYGTGFFLSVLAGASTILGCAFIPLAKSELVSQEKAMAVVLSFAAGVMLWVSLVDVLTVEARHYFRQHFSLRDVAEQSGLVHGWEALFFFLGIVVVLLFDYLVDRFAGQGPSAVDATLSPASDDIASTPVANAAAGEVTQVPFSQTPEDFDTTFLRLASEDAASTPAADIAAGEVMQARTAESQQTIPAVAGDSVAAASQHAAAAPAEENAAEAALLDDSKVPTGESVAAKGDSGPPMGSLARVSFVTMVALMLHNFPEGLATFFDGSVGGLTVVLAVGLHNIPEGMAVALPIYASSGSYSRAFVATFLAGLAQPIGALTGWFALLLLPPDSQRLPSFTFGAMYAATAGVMVAIAVVGLLPEAFRMAPSVVPLSLIAGFLVMELAILFLEAAESAV